MADNATPAEMREQAKRLRHRLTVEGGTYGSRSDIRAGADALDRLADVIEYAEREASWASMQRENQLWVKLQKVLRIARWGGADR